MQAWQFAQYGAPGRLERVDRPLAEAVAAHAAVAQGGAPVKHVLALSGAAR